MSNAATAPQLLENHDAVSSVGRLLVRGNMHIPITTSASRTEHNRNDVLGQDFDGRIGAYIHRSATCVLTAYSREALLLPSSQSASACITCRSLHRAHCWPQARKCRQSAAIAADSRAFGAFAPGLIAAKHRTRRYGRASDTLARMSLRTSVEAGRFKNQESSAAWMLLFRPSAWGSAARRHTCKLAH